MLAPKELVKGCKSQNLTLWGTMKVFEDSKHDGLDFKLTEENLENVRIVLLEEDHQRSKEIESFFPHAFDLVAGAGKADMGHKTALYDSHCICKRVDADVAKQQENLDPCWAIIGYQHPLETMQKLELRHYTDNFSG